MSEKSPASANPIQDRLDGFEKQAKQNTRDAYFESLMGDAGIGDTSKDAYQRLEDVKELDEYYRQHHNTGMYDEITGASPSEVGVYHETFEVEKPLPTIGDVFRLANEARAAEELGDISTSNERVAEIRNHLDDMMTNGELTEDEYDSILQQVVQNIDAVSKTAVVPERPSTKKDEGPTPSEAIPSTPAEEEPKKSREERTREAARAAFDEASKPEEPKPTDEKGKSEKSASSTEDRTAEAAAAAMGDADKTPAKTPESTPKPSREDRTAAAAREALDEADESKDSDSAEASEPYKPLDTSEAVDDSEFKLRESQMKAFRGEVREDESPLSLEPKEEYDLLGMVIAKNRHELVKLKKRNEKMSRKLEDSTTYNEKKRRKLEDAIASNLEKRRELEDTIDEGVARHRHLRRIISSGEADKATKKTTVTEEPKKSTHEAAAPAGIPGKDRPATSEEIKEYQMKQEAIEDDALKRFKVSWADRAFFPTKEKKDMVKATKAINRRRKNAYKQNLADHLTMAGLEDNFTNRMKAKRAASKVERDMRTSSDAADTPAKRLRYEEARTAAILEELKK